MPPELLPDDASSYDSAEDEDFAPDSAPAAIESSDSESEVDSATPKSAPKKKRKHADTQEAEDLGFENSGDEAIIDKGLKKRRRKGKGREGKEEEDEGGEGGLIKTRSMRAAEKIEKKPLATTASSTIDVDALFNSMITGIPLPSNVPPPSPSKSPLKSPLSPTTQRIQLQTKQRKNTRSPSTTLSDGPDSMILINRTYTFAGKQHTEQKLVPRNSAEAQLYLSTLPEKVSKAIVPNTAAVDSNTLLPLPSSDPHLQTSPHPPKRHLKLARRSIFEPIPPEGLPKRTDLFFGERKRDSGVQTVGVVGAGGKKLNTVEKSAMDWAGFVDKEGLKDELVLAGKSKGAFKERVEFLRRVEERKEVEERRGKGLAPVM